VNAASEFGVRAAAAEQSVDFDGLPGPARCTTARREKGPLHTLLVLLGDNRLYSADALNVSCETLRQFAQAAVARIGPQGQQRHTVGEMSVDGGAGDPQPLRDVDGIDALAS
jgi:hypothetical protein